MSRDDDFHVRLGRVRNQGRGVNKPFVGRVLASAHKAGGLYAGRSRDTRSTFGRGRAAAFLAGGSLTARSRRVVVKARVVRQKAGASAPLSAHLRYLRRDGVTKEGEPARMFGAVGQDSDTRAFSERCEGDRHHFRFIVSPDDAQIALATRSDLPLEKQVDAQELHGLTASSWGVSPRQSDRRASAMRCARQWTRAWSISSARVWPSAKPNGWCSPATFSIRCGARA